MTAAEELLLGGFNARTSWKAPCLVAALTPITLAGEQTIDDVAMSSGNRVLVTGQSAAEQNGIYVVSTGAWTRAHDFADSRSAQLGTTVIVTAGTANAGVYRMTSPVTGDVRPGETETTWTLVGAMDSASTTEPTGIANGPGLLEFDGFGNLSLSGTPTASLEASSMTFEATGTTLGFTAASTMSAQGSGISIRAGGVPAAPSAGQVLIRGTTIELTGTLTNNGSPIGGGSYTAGDGLTLTGSDFDVDLSDTTIFSNAGVASRALVLDGSSRVIATALRRTGGTLTVETITSGDVVLAAADAVAISATVGGVAVNANTAIALNAATGDGSITLDGSGNIDVQVIAGGTLTETIGSASRTVTASGANRTETYGGNYSLIPGGNLVLGASGQDAYINCWGFQGTAYTNGFIFYTTNRAFRVADYNGLAEIILRPTSDTATTDATQTTIATITPSTTRPTQFEVLVRVEDASGNMKAWHDVVACRGQGGSAAFSGGGTGAVGATVNGTADAAVTTCALEYDCSTTMVRVRATGIAATNLTWSVTILEVH